MKNRIYIKHWLLLKPYDDQVKTDSYYLKLSNEVRQALASSQACFPLRMFLEEEDYTLFSCFITSYFEDIISGTNIWKTFMNIYERLYGKKMPFYDTDEYFEDEINEQDIKFLTWYFLNSVISDKFIDPHNDIFPIVAIEIFDIFDKAWEYAPENEDLKAACHIDENQDDFYRARELTDKLLLRTYLFYPDAGLHFKKLFDEFLEDEEDIDMEYAGMIFNEYRDITVHSYYTRLLSMRGSEWVAEFLPQGHRLKKAYAEISEKISGYYLYKGKDEEYVQFEHIASGKHFNVLRQSVDFTDTLEKEDTIVYMGIVRWQGEWHFSGSAAQQPFNADLILDEKNSLEKRRAVSFLDHDTHKTHEYLQSQLTVFKEINNGSQIAFMPVDQVEKFLNTFQDAYNKSLDPGKAGLKKAKDKLRKDGFFGDNQVPDEFSENPESAIVFFNPESGVEIAWGLNSAFPMPSNPYYYVDESREHVMDLLTDSSISAELAKFCMENCKDKIPFISEGEGRHYLVDLDFLLRFWKQGSYHAKPVVSYINSK